MATANPQYQHFVPRFLLRNFAHPYKPNGDGPRKRKGGGKPKYEKGMFPKDPVVRCLDLLVDPPVICEKPVGRILGQMNMYDDMSKPADQQHAVEKILSQLECSASEIFRKITEAFEQEEGGLWLTRDERDTIRKFLFVIKYRGDGFRKRFFHSTPEEYNENDQELLREYMSKHGFKSPLDVWFHNIKTIVEIKMGGGMEWLPELTRCMYPEDAMWFWSHCEHYYMAICTPSSAEDEFVLTDNSYNIFEGPNHHVECMDTGEVGGGVHTPLHQFAPISPKLMIVLRCNMLPNPLEDANEDVRKWREFQRFLVVDGVYDYKVKSLLADLPIEKARNNYSQIVNGRLHLNNGENWEPSKDDKFCFKFFPVGSEHVHMINGILLDNVMPCSSVVFDSQESFARTLEWYLTAPLTVGKRITGPNATQRRAMLKRLETVSHALGSTKATVQVEIPNDTVPSYKKYISRHTEKKRKMFQCLNGEIDGRELLEEMIKESSPQPSQPKLHPPAQQIYELLGGSSETLFEDFDQAGRMWKLRVKIDAWSKDKVDETTRQRNRELVLDAYLRLPPHRVWHYTKLVRFMHVFKYQGEVGVGNLEAYDGPEDVIARACRVVKPDRLAKLIYTAGMNDTEKRTRPWLDLWGDFTHDRTSSAWTYLCMRLLLFYTPGYIRDCGIPDVEQLAHQAQLQILKSGRYKTTGVTLKFFDEGEMIELLTRVVVRERFIHALNGELDKATLKELKKVLFETAFPTPPLGWRYMN